MRTLKGPKPPRRIPAKLLREDILLGLQMAEEAHAYYGTVEIWDDLGRPQPTNEEAQRLLEGLADKRPVSRAYNGGLPF
jgi:hypothetical protein